LEGLKTGHDEIEASRWEGMGRGVYREGVPLPSRLGGLGKRRKMSRFDEQFFRALSKYFSG